MGSSGGRRTTRPGRAGPRSTNTVSFAIPPRACVTDTSDTAPSSPAAAPGTSCGWAEIQCSSPTRSDSSFALTPADHLRKVAPTTQPRRTDSGQRPVHTTPSLHISFAFSLTAHTGADCEGGGRAPLKRRRAPFAKVLGVAGRAQSIAADCSSRLVCQAGHATLPHLADVGFGASRHVPLVLDCDRHGLARARMSDDVLCSALHGVRPVREALRDPESQPTVFNCTA